MKFLPRLAALLPLALAGCGGSGDGTAAFDDRFSRVDVDNDRCVLDNRTGLLWEGKSDVPGLHDFRNTYTWWDPNEANRELDYRGVEDGGVCAGSRCDTWHFVRAVNEAGYCGHADWRVPARDDLLSISDLRKAATPPTTSTEAFPFAQPVEYWSGNDYSFQWDAAWAWNFQYGHDRVDWKRTPKLVRLVRGTGHDMPEVKE